MVRPFTAARSRTAAERRRIRLEPCCICYRQGPSFVYDASRHDYDGWLGKLWPLCLHHRWEIQRLGWKEFMAHNQIDA